MKRKILVTGGAGFIGSHTVDLLLEKDWRVVVYDNFATGKLSNLDLLHPDLQVVQGDVLDYAKLAKEISYCQAVLHLAALPSVPKSIEDPIASLRVNTQGFVHVLQAVRELNKPIRLVYASSAAVYGATDVLPCSDEAPLSALPLSPYALEKANNERYAALFADLFHVKSMGLRYFNVYGPRQDPKSPYSGVISKFIEHYKKQQPIVIFGDGEQSRDFIYVTDIARANWLAVESDYVGNVNIATGIPETLNNLVRYIEKIGGAAAQVERVASRSGDIPLSYAATMLAAQFLQFKFDVSLEQGIKFIL